MYSWKEFSVQKDGISNLVWNVESESLLLEVWCDTLVADWQ